MIPVEGGYFTLGRFRGAPIRIHWSFILLAIWVGGRSPGAWIGFFLLILWHEMGHAVLVRWCKHRVIELRVSGIGGACVWDGPSGMLDESLIAWGGVWAQGLLFWIAQTTLDFGLWPESTLIREILVVFLGANVWIMLFNLLPIPPLDGSRAWLLFPALYQRAKWDDSVKTVHQPAAPIPPAADEEAPRSEKEDQDKEALFQKILGDLQRAKNVTHQDEEE